MAPKPGPDSGPDADEETGADIGPDTGQGPGETRDRTACAKKGRKGLPETARSLPIALIRARERVMAPIREMLSETGITEQQWRVLRVLAETGESDATELAERAALHLPSLTRIVRTLGERGYLTRQQDAQDKRRQVLAITGAGRAVIEANRARAVDIVDTFRATLGAARYEELLDLLEELGEAEFQRPGPGAR